MTIKENGIIYSAPQETPWYRGVTGKIVASGVVLIGVTAITAGALAHFSLLSGINAMTKCALMGGGAFVEIVLLSIVIYLKNSPKKPSVTEIKSKNTPLRSSTVNDRPVPAKKRAPKGFLKSPYSPKESARFLMNHVTDGAFSYINRDFNPQILLKKEGEITLHSGSQVSTIKVVFLGDIMVSKSGNPPQMDDGLKSLLKSAQIIIANVEAPVVKATDSKKRGLSLKFEMNVQYLESISACNREAQWVFSIANNHACDTSDLNDEDVSGVITTIETIKFAIPQAEIIGADIDTAKPTLSLQIANGPKIGIIAWTEVMNSDRKHYKKRILREDDITEEMVTRTKVDHDILIGFPHGNEEQSYYPLKEVRDRWLNLTGPLKFDMIIGHGPHVLHPAELVSNRGVIFHSIGNFCSPVGGDQTKIGCVPEFDLTCDENGKPTNMHYKVNLLEQKDETVSLLTDTDEKTTSYPKIIKRLKKIWPNLFQ